MSEDQALSLTAALGALALVASSVFARRLPPRPLIKLALVWVAIFATGYLLIRTLL